MKWKKIEHFHQNLKKTLSYTNILHSNGQIAAENIISKIFQTFSESSSPWKSDWSCFDKNANPNPEIIIDSRSNKFLTKIRINYTFIFFLFFLFSQLQTVSFKWFRFRVTRLSTRPRWPSFEFQLIQIYPRVSSPCHRVNKTFHGTIATKILLCP